MGLRALALAAALASLAACASTQGPPKPHELPASQRAGVSGALEPLLTAAKLWRGPDDGCAAAYRRGGRGDRRGGHAARAMPGPAGLTRSPSRRSIPRRCAPYSRTRSPTCSSPTPRRGSLGPTPRSDREERQDGEQRRVQGSELHSRRRRSGVEGDRHGAEGHHHGDGDAGHALPARGSRRQTPWPSRS